MSLVIHIDGGARGNPGPAGAGVSIRTEAGEVVFEAGFFLGHQTNNFAEYTALIRALEYVVANTPAPLMIYSDSDLLVQQMTGHFKVKSPNLAALHQHAQKLLIKVPRWSFRHVRREENRRADELANLAMDRKRDVIVYDQHGGSAAARGEGNGSGPARPNTEPNRAATTPDRPPSANSAKPPAFQGSSPGPTGASPSLFSEPRSDLGPESTTPPGAASHSGAHGDSSAERDGRVVRVAVTVTRRPASGQCLMCKGPARFIVGASLPEGICLHAASAILPTVIAIQDTRPAELPEVPTMTILCGRRGCGAVLHVEPQLPPNGEAGH